MSFADDIKISLGQLKKFNKSVTDQKCLLKVGTISFCLDKSLSFSSNNIFLYITIYFEKYGLHAFQNDFELQSTLSFSKYCNLAFLFRFATKFHRHLNLTMSLGFFWLICLVFETSGYHLLAKVLIKMGFLKFLFSWEHVYLKCKQNYFQSLHGFSNLNWSLSSCLRLWYINFFDSNFSNFVFRNVYIIWWWLFQPLSKEFS